MTIWRLRIACWITKATKIISDYVIFTVFPQQNLLQEHARTQAHNEEIKRKQEFQTQTAYSSNIY
jgi:hypothetical protein